MGDGTGLATGRAEAMAAMPVEQGLGRAQRAQILRACQALDADLAQAKGHQTCRGGQCFPGCRVVTHGKAWRIAVKPQKHPVCQRRTGRQFGPGEQRLVRCAGLEDDRIARNQITASRRRGEGGIQRRSVGPAVVRTVECEMGEGQMFGRARFAQREDPAHAPASTMPRAFNALDSRSLTMPSRCGG